MISYINCEKKDITIENLYTSRNNDNPHRLKAIYKDDSFSYDVILDGRDDSPDCKISSFGANIYFRTRNGINRKRYSSIKAIEKAIKTASKKYGLELYYLEITKGEPAII